MTTIIYNHHTGEIGCDGLVTGGNGQVIKTDSVKKHEVEGMHIFLSGDLSDYNDFLSTFGSGNECREVNCSGLAVINGDVFTCYVQEGVHKLALVDCNDHSGSGGVFALAALDHGAGTREAIEYACSRDVFSGGTVQVYKVAELSEVGQ